MELLNSDEQQVLIDLLRELPEIEYPHVRFLLVATLPKDMKDNMHLGHSVKSDIASIVGTVSNEAYASWEIGKGQYPILLVIKNAIGKVGGGPLAVKLHDKLVLLRARFGLDPEEATGSDFPSTEGNRTADSSRDSEHFMKDLYNFIQKLPELNIQLDDLYETFSSYIIRPDCHAAYIRLNSAFTPAREFLVTLEEEQSKDWEIKARGLLKSAVLDFKNKQEEAGKHIRHFCDAHGAKIRENQPVEAREFVQKQLYTLLLSYRSVLKMANELYNELCTFSSSKKKTSD